MRSELAPALLDRRRERGVLDGLLENLRAGRGAALVLRGEAGVGKSALLEYLTGAAAGMRVVRAAGTESEMELAFASSQLLCAPLLDRLERLPAPQRDALGTAFGLREGAAPDRFKVGLAVLTLLSEVAEERPLLCVVDDAQWLDRESAQVLAFAARRLLAEPVGLIFAAREPGEQFQGLPDLEVRGLEDRDSRTLLRSVIRSELDERVRDRILAETNGNPLALLELPRGLSPMQLAAGFGLVGAVPARIEEGFRRRLEALPADTRSLMLVAAAEPGGDAMLVWQAMGRFGIAPSAAAAAEADGLLEIRMRVRFRHPLVRSAVYAAASLPERRAAHLALAEVTDGDRDPDRRAWHLAAAAPGPDEEVAAELERSAGRAQARGGLAAAMAFLQRSAELTAEPVRRSERALAAAQVSLQAGAFDAAAEMLAVAEAGPLDELQSARACLLRGHVTFTSGLGNEGPPLLLEAAKRLEPLDLDIARETYLTAWTAALFAGRLATRGNLLEVSRAARELPWSVQPGKAELILDALTLLVTNGPAAAAPTLRRALAAFAEADTTLEEEIRWGWFAHAAALALWDHDIWRAILERQVKIIRDAGSLDRLPIMLASLGVATLWAGDFAATAALIAESDTVCEVTGTPAATFTALAVMCLRGNTAQALPVIQATIAEATDGGQGLTVAHANWVAAILFNGLGRYEEALAAAIQSSENAPGLYVSLWALPELIEAAARTGSADQATDAMARVAEVAQAGGTDAGLGLAARCCALLSEGQAADRLYREAIERLSRTQLRPDLARTHLLYGEWLRRENRRADARSELRTAHDMLATLHIEGFAERARRELQAAGETVRKRTAETRDQLTPQEAQIARLARAGLSNPEIGAQLFLSARTVEWHLRKVFTKLDISSRRQLEQALPNGASALPKT